MNTTEKLNRLAELQKEWGDKANTATLAAIHHQNVADNAFVIHQAILAYEEILEKAYEEILENRKK